MKDIYSCDSNCPVCADNKARYWRVAQWAFWFIVCAFILWGGLTFSQIADAAEIDAKQAANLYQLAHTMTGLPLADKPPRIEIVPGPRISELMDDPHGRYDGAYISETDTIYLNDEIDYDSNPYAGMLLLHESVHYLQYHARGKGDTCEEWAGRELQAYGVEIAAMEQQGLDTRRTRINASNYLSVCYRANAKPGKAGASSERLAAPATGKDWRCFLRRQVAIKMEHFKASGGGMVDWWYANPLPDGWSTAMQEDAKQLVLDLFTADDGAEGDVIKRRFDACLSEVGK